MVLGWYLLKLTVFGNFNIRFFGQIPVSEDKYLTDMVNKLRTKRDHLLIFMRTRLSLKIFLFISSLLLVTIQLRYQKIAIFFAFEATIASKGKSNFLSFH